MMKLRERKGTKAEVEFWLKVLRTLKGAGADLNRSIEIIGNKLKEFDKKFLNHSRNALGRHTWIFLSFDSFDSA